MKNALTDIEILAWNDRLSKTGEYNLYMINPVYTDKSIYPSIVIREITSFSSVSKEWGRNLYEMPSTDITNSIKIEYDFSFSLPIEKEKLFNTIYTNLSANKILNLVGDKNYREINLEYLNVKENIVYHTLLSKNYIRYDYTFDGPLPEIMAYIKNIDDAIAFTILKPKFKINDIISLKNNKSVDFLVLDYKYEIDKGKYKYYYLVKEFFIEEEIVKYGNLNRFSEDIVCNSRNHIIDDIIGK